ncbi:MAG: Fic family protein, partial [Tunicatimonas sp.]
MLPLESALQLKQELDTLRPLRPEDEQRIMQKFRLDGNYHSNHLEGNSLTYGETKALLLFNITAQGKPLQDHLEITGHNEALKWIEEVVKEERPLTENFIRQLHQLILKEDYQVNAITPDGKPTKKWVRVGRYKTEPNHVITATGETFYFATPEETPAKMHDLMEWFRYKAKQDGVAPILIAAEFHYRFIRIHPFDDGNGRTTRILMNFILMQFGYPPAIVKTEDKQRYFAVLQQADAGVLTPFVEFIATNVVRSLEIMIKGAKGEDIEESDDLDKELALLEHRLKTNIKAKKTEKASRKKTSESAILKFFQSSISPLFEQFFSACLKFRRFYKSGYFVFSFSEEATAR